MARELSVNLSVAGIPAARVMRFHAVHEAGRPLVLEVEAVLDEYQEPGDLGGQPAHLGFGAVGEEPRFFSGIIEVARVLGATERGTETRGTHYAFRVVSELALLAYSVESRIYQDLAVKEIVADVLARHGVARVEWRLAGSYPKREYCVQYQESALAFISRLLEHEGIFSFVEADGESETIVFADDSRSAAPIPGNPELPSRRRAAMADGRDAVYVLRLHERVRSGKFTLRDYDFKRPQLDLTAASAAGEHAELEVYDYPGGYVEPSEGERLARVRLEAEQVERRTVGIEAVSPHLAVGRKLTITDAGDAEGEYFVFAATHTYVHQGARRDAFGKAVHADPPQYAVTARLVPAAVKYRPARTTPIPRIEGPQTATVVAPRGAPAETIHTDKHGRCKVKFHWDRAEANDDRASCWIRTAQLQTSGSMVLPRIGWEVIVEFLEADPDRPIVTGRLYNGVFMPPYALPEGKTRTAIKTASTPGGGGNNEIRMEDRAGSEEIMMFAQHDMTVAVANNNKKSVGNNETTVVGNNAELHVGADQTIKITKGSSNTIGANQTVKVGGNRNVEVNAVTALNVHANATMSVGGNQLEMDGNPLEALLALAAQAAEQFVASMADNAVNAVKGHVDGAVNQVMGPINKLNAQIQKVSQGMQAVGAGNLGGLPGMIAGASSLPGASDLAASTGGGPGGAPSTNAVAGMAAAAARGALHQGVGAGHGAPASALGLDGAGSGNASMANGGGPAGDVAGVDQTDREKGPGHTTALIGGTHAETVGSMKITGAIKTIDTNVTGAKSINVGAATVQLAIGNYAETVGGAKKEAALGLVVLTKQGESEQVAGSKTTMVGGAVVDKLKGSHAIEAGGPATFIGAFHKVEAAGSITFKCGASTVVIDAAGVTIKSPIVAFLSPKIQLPKKVSEI